MIKVACMVVISLCTIANLVTTLISKNEVEKLVRFSKKVFRDE